MKVNEGVIVEVIDSPNQGIKFFRDRKISLSAMKDFAKDAKEMKELVKTGAYYELASIKKLWRFVLRAIISYITLDTRYERIHTHKFVILNHFKYGTKISITFYLFFSAGFKKKVYANPAFHKGLLLLIYEHFKAQTCGRAVAHKKKSLEDTESSYLPSDTEDSTGLHSYDEEEVAKIMKDMGSKKKKTGKGLEGRIKPEVYSVEEYNEEEEGMEMDEEGNVKEVGTNKEKESRKDVISAKRRRGGDKEAEKAHGKGKETNLEA